MIPVRPLINRSPRITNERFTENEEAIRPSPGSIEASTPDVQALSIDREAEAEVQLEGAGDVQVSGDPPDEPQFAVATQVAGVRDGRDQRRMIERLSGWRLVAFLVSAMVNLGLLVGLVSLPWLLNPSRLYGVVAMVMGSHAVVLLAIAGFRYSVSVKVLLGVAHASGCAATLASVNAFPVVDLGAWRVATLYAIPMMTMVVTIGGIVFAKRLGFHRGSEFSIVDMMIVVAACAILIPMIQVAIPGSSLTRVLEGRQIIAAGVFALTSCVWCLVVANVFLKLLPGAEHGKTPLQIGVGVFLLNTILDWNACQFGLMVATWVAFSLIPIWGIERSNPQACEGD